MAQQLIQDRSPAGYAGVEAYARATPKKTPARWPGWSSAMLTSSITTTRRRSTAESRQAAAGDLGDYVAYYLGTCYLKPDARRRSGGPANFETNYPDSLLVRDAHLSYANALLTEGRAAEAAELSRKIVCPRAPISNSLLGRRMPLSTTCQSFGGSSNVYYKMPRPPKPTLPTQN